MLITVEEGALHKWQLGGESAQVGCTQGGLRSDAAGLLMVCSSPFVLLAYECRQLAE